MTTYALDKVIRSVASFNGVNGDEAVVALHFASPAICTQAEVNGAASAWEQVWTTVVGGHALKSFYSSLLVLQSATARTLDPANPLEHTEVFGIAGTGSDVPVPAESSVITTLYTDLPTRRGRGRMFMPGLDSAWTEHGSLPASPQALMNACWAAMQAAIPGSDGIEQVVWSKSNNTARTVEAYLTRAYLGHQRRRRS